MLVLAWVLRYFWERGNIRKGVRWNRRLRLLYMLCIEVSRKFHLHFTLTFQLRYYKMVQSLCKNWILVSKITWRIWTTSDKHWTLQKVEIWWANFSKKHIPSAKTLYTEKIYVTSLSTTCVKIHQMTNVIFETISHFSWQNCSVFFSSNITYFLEK